MARKKRPSDVLRLVDRIIRDAPGRSERDAIVRRVRQAAAFHDFMAGWSFASVHAHMNEEVSAESAVRMHGQRLLARKGVR